VSLADGELTDLGVSGTNPYYVASGHIVFGRPGGLLFAAPFSLRKGVVTGPARLLVEGVGQGTGGGTGFAVSDNGTLVYHRSGFISGGRFALVAVDRSGRERSIPVDSLAWVSPRVSPDGQRIAVGRRDAGTVQSISLIEVRTGARQVLVERPVAVNPNWERTGQRVLYVGGTARAREVISRAVHRGGSDRVLLRDTALNVIAASSAPSGGHLAYSVLGTSGLGNDIHIAPSDTPGVARPFVASTASELHAEVSPDGRWLAYTSNESGRFEVYVQPLPGPGPRLQVSVNGGREPVWASEQALYYRGSGRIRAATLGGSPLRVTRHDSLFAETYIAEVGRNWDVFPGAREFLFVSHPVTTTTSEITVVLNWQQMAGPQQTNMGRP
jgi:hypothetical protein